MARANSFAMFVQNRDEALRLGEIYTGSSVMFVHGKNFSAVVIAEWDMPKNKPANAIGFPECFTSLAAQIANGRIQPPPKTDGS
jgi:hypothetical protein